MKRLLIGIIRWYQHAFSHQTVHSCVFLPTCSEYAITAIERFGAMRGTWMAFRRVLRCHPWQKNRIDMVPENY